ncbi:MAG: helix-turn-helix transcriptional regulator [Myxococcales bacterium]|nr:helix-turn-helix transcriptional regulator [Myxococcales bacterium]
MARKLSKPRPAQGAHLVALRKAAGLSQTELAELVGQSQANIAYWERIAKPPRSDVLPTMAEVLGVSIDELLNTGAAKKRAKRAGPVGRTQKLFEDVSKLPRRQQEKVVEVVSAMLDQYRRKAG